ncbi:MAG TPA: N-acetylmuramoyl-L-alanine amidase [Thermoanaerobaculia bacterium]|nr:N-acetylmuramoyl-L-alanine amidase [Thermoanaerobaculia bacterium]
MKRRVLQEAVAENLDTIRGLPPRAVRPAPRALRLWLKRTPFVLLPLMLAGTAYMMTTDQAQAPAPIRAAAAVVRPVFQAAEATPQVERVTATAFPLAVRRVVLDAGHGGTDPGATAAELLEKEITLDIGRRLRTKLEGDGFEVVVTRDSDKTIALRERARLANDSRSDIFVSIHVNALLKHTDARGIETYYLGATTDPKLTQLAAAENRVSGYSIADMRALLDGVYADARRDESMALAGAVQRELFTTLRKADPGLENWGVKRAPFLVLVATDMPAVLAEVGCISNEKEAAMLRRPEYRQQIADALFAGIRGYAKKGSENNG